MRSKRGPVWSKFRFRMRHALGSESSQAWRTRAGFRWHRDLLDRPARTTNSGIALVTCGVGAQTKSPRRGASGSSWMFCGTGCCGLEVFVAQRPTPSKKGRRRSTWLVHLEPGLSESTWFSPFLLLLKLLFGRPRWPSFIGCYDPRRAFCHSPSNPIRGARNPVGPA